MMQVLLSSIFNMLNLRYRAEQVNPARTDFYAFVTFAQFFFLAENAAIF